MTGRREIYFHEDDYCQQQLLPRSAAEHVNAELAKIEEFSAAHLTPDGAGWTDMYVRQTAPTEFVALGISHTRLEGCVSGVMPQFDLVYTGYSSYREACKRTAAWGLADRCALFADWNEQGVVTNVWAEFFDRDEESIVAASKAVAAIGAIHPLIYVDWAWGYVCDASDERTFATSLRAKLEKIESL